MNQKNQYNITIIGLGYGGLPLAIEFGKIFHTIGFDKKKKRIDDLQKGIDSNLEFSDEDIRSAKHLSFTSNKLDLNKSNIYIITVPTQI
mgnify:CR=1 FL=1